jgi:hypothetical protein
MTPTPLYPRSHHETQALDIIDIRRDLDDTGRAHIDVMLSHAPDQLDVEAAKNTGLGLQEGVASTTIPVRVGNLRGNIVRSTSCWNRSTPTRKAFDFSTKSRSRRSWRSRLRSIGADKPTGLSQPPHQTASQPTTGHDFKSRCA